MDFLRRHLFIILCGAACAAGIGLGVTGLNAMPKVIQEMENTERLYQQLGSLQSQPVNQDRIDAENQRIELMKEDHDKVFSEAGDQYGYEPLVEGVFPDGDPLKRIEFRERYAEAMEQLLESFHYGGPATPTDVARWREGIEDEEAARREYGLDSNSPQAAPPPEGPEHTPAGVLTQDGARVDAPARAAMANAQRIYCYAVHFDDEKPPSRVASLDFDPAVEDTGAVDAPALEEVWRAQLGYWIQKDVVNAITGINNDVAERARKNGEDVWVGVMPVKEVISVRISPDYVLPEGDLYAVAAPSGYEAALPPGTAESVFTGTASTDIYEVLQFTVKLIMDQRDIPLLVDRLCKNSFHTLVRVAYEALPPNRDMVGKIYGAEPVVNAVMDFETILLGEVFRPLMPQKVCEDYDINCPEREEDEEEG